MYNIRTSWTACIYAGSFLVIIFSTIIKLSFSQKSDEQSETQKKLKQKDSSNQHKFSSQQKKQESKCQDSFHKITDFLLTRENYLFLIGLILLTGIQEVTMMFLPLFLKVSGYQAYSGYVTAGFMAFFIIGALSFSLFANRIQTENLGLQSSSTIESSQINQYKSISNNAQTNKSQNRFSKIKYLKTVCLFLLVVCMLLLTINQFATKSNKLTNENVLVYAILLSLSGFFIGAPLSQYESFQILRIINRNKRTDTIDKNHKKGDECLHNKNPNRENTINDIHRSFSIQDKRQHHSLSGGSELIQKGNFSNQIKNEKFQSKKKQGYKQSSSSQESSKSSSEPEDRNKPNHENLLSQHQNQLEQEVKPIYPQAQKGKFKMTHEQLLMGVIQFCNYLVVIPFLIIAGKILQIDLNFFFLFLAVLCVVGLGVDFLRLFTQKDQIKIQYRKI